jgi:IS30 family transposase
MAAKNNKRRLTFDDRMTVQGMLELGKSLSEIAERIGCSRSTVLREVGKNSFHQTGREEWRCPRLLKSKVCNACRKRHLCGANQTLYECQYAQHASEERMSVARQVPRLSRSEIEEVSGIVADGVSRGQSLHHIYVANPELKKICTEQTVRRLCLRRLLKTKPHELRRFVVYKHEYEKPLSAPRISKMCHIIGRNHQDFVRFMAKHKRAGVVQFDSVIGKRGDGLAILTLTWAEQGFQIGFVISKDDPNSVNRVLTKFLSSFTPEERRALFTACIADNGIEFSYFWQLDEKFPEIRCFYTRPYRSNDKAECERNHEFIRYVHPKGESFDSITQEHLDDLFSNINSYVRKSKGDRTPYRIMERKFGKSVMAKMRVKKVALKNVSLSRK